MRRTLLRLEVVPLTPVLIGDGTTLQRFDWRLGANADGQPELEIIEEDVAFAGLDERTRGALLQDLEAGDITAATTLMHARLPANAIIGRRVLGPQAAALLTGTTEDPPVYRFMRTADQILVPGSSLKGVLRSAVLAALAPSREQALRAVTRSPERNQMMRLRELEATTLDHPVAATEQDLLRYIRVPDLTLQPRHLRVDRVAWFEPGGDRAPKAAPLAVERLRCLADRGQVPCFDWCIEIEAAEDHARRKALSRRSAPPAPLSEADLWRILRDHGRSAWQAESRRWRRDCPIIAERLVYALHRTNLDREDIALIRLGRFGHAASKTVSALQPGTDPPPTRSYSLAETGDAEAPGWLPFGWLRLQRLRTQSAAPVPTAS